MTSNQDPEQPTWEIEETPPGPKGLSGWLGLLAILVLIGALRTGYSTLTEILPLFLDETWSLLTTPGSDFYHPFWAPLMVFELAANSVFTFYGFFVFVLFLRESAAARPHFNTYALASLGVIVLDAALVKIVLPDEPMLDPETRKEAFRSAVFAAVWIPYLHFSVRAQNTLVK